MKLEEARVLTDRACMILEGFCDRVEVAGSIRRGKAEVGDIDIVALPKAVDLPGGLCGVVKVDPSTVWKNLIPKALLKAGLKMEAAGQELMRFSFPVGNMQVDIYRARPETWGIILLVRTGSKEHNVKLCTLAKRFAPQTYPYGLRLSASQGVIVIKANGTDGRIIASNSEEAIFAELGLAFVEPKDREVSW